MRGLQWQPSLYSVVAPNLRHAGSVQPQTLNSVRPLWPVSLVGESGTVDNLHQLVASSRPARPSYASGVFEFPAPRARVSRPVVRCAYYLQNSTLLWTSCRDADKGKPRPAGRFLAEEHHFIKPRNNSTGRYKSQKWPEVSNSDGL
jgi:hypothetical protein